MKLFAAFRIPLIAIFAVSLLSGPSFGQSGNQTINGTQVFTVIDQGRGVATFSNDCGSQTLTQGELQGGAIPSEIIPCPRPMAPTSTGPKEENGQLKSQNQAYCNADSSSLKTTLAGGMTCTGSDAPECRSLLADISRECAAAGDRSKIASAQREIAAAKRKESDRVRGKAQNECDAAVSTVRPFIPSPMSDQKRRSEFIAFLNSNVVSMCRSFPDKLKEIATIIQGLAPAHAPEVAQGSGKNPQPRDLNCHVVEKRRWRAGFFYNLLLENPCNDRRSVRVTTCDTISAGGACYVTPPDSIGANQSEKYESYQKFPEWSQ
jgi:hypothetical protein